MTALKWETPSVGYERTGKWTAALAELQTRPGEWAIVYEGPPGEDPGKSRNRKNALRSVATSRGIRVEASTRLVDGVVRVYARVLP